MEGMNEKVAQQADDSDGSWLCIPIFGWQIIMLSFPQPIATISKI
jgi:hypothetical protein